MTLLASSIQERGDHVYITCPVSLYEPEQTEIETFAFAENLRAAAPNPKILWLRGQYVEADNANANGDEWTAGELSIKALTPVLMPITVMHDMRSAVGTIADARLLTPDADKVPRARIDTTLAVWEHRFPEIAAEIRANAGQGTLMQSMECLSPYFDCTHCGQMLQRTHDWKEVWKRHVSQHDSLASDGRSPARRLRNVTFTGAGLIFGTRGARGAMPSAHLEVEELAAMHSQAHQAGAQRKPRRTNTVEIEDGKYEALVAAKADGESKVTDLTAKLADAERKLEVAEAGKLSAEEARDAAKAEAETAKETSRVAAMKEERISALGTGFVAKLDKLETTAKRVRVQAGTLTDEEWEARLVELEETLAVKRDAAIDATPAAPGANGEDTTAGLLFARKDVTGSGVAGATEVTAQTAATEPPSVQQRQSAMRGLIRGPQKQKAKA